ncbi:hypothetical protein BDZ45DRAFT_692523 [Acephala macrosclerotiorum]|nr:hypothetical protein BDZ45DRAFT_692523 [Acephala macrosclerotiorum]
MITTWQLEHLFLIIAHQMTPSPENPKNYRSQIETTKMLNPAIDKEGKFDHKIFELKFLRNFLIWIELYFYMMYSLIAHEEEDNPFSISVTIARLVWLWTTAPVFSFLIRELIESVKGAAKATREGFWGFWDGRERAGLKAEAKV